MTGLLRANAIGICAAALLLGGAAAAVRFVARSRSAPPPRKLVQFTMVNLEKPPPARPATPQPEPKEEEPVHSTRVNLKPIDFAPPEAARPAQPSAGGGRLALAAEGSGPGDAFNLTGNPGGRGLLGGGGLGDGSGDGVGEGGPAGNRYGWYYARIAGEIEAAFRSVKPLTSAAMRVELRVWADDGGRISRVELIRSTGDEAVDRAIQSVVGTRLSEPPPAGIPMPMIARLTARRPR